jgi:hypothetical protein
LLASAAHRASPSTELMRLRRATLDAGRATRSAQREQALALRLRALGFAGLASYLRHAQETGTSLRNIAKVTRLGRGRLQRELEAAGITIRPAMPPGAPVHLDGQRIPRCSG